ncbi:hypothetical protein [Kordiimonas sp. SCSIO 12610]|uniref:hypothetical protein n=1 Tax=Kordiimonas sp. SCSIO 12610 TaxID=2829597 RepID=UPI00210F1FF3|nr:hypothetical protein [Kordiimonas sp. SCSIO 12610]UTW54889.1 hypothetical protein KFF44_13925 [Kordiimonas sp. SCSIO 12610]
MEIIGKNQIETILEKADLFPAIKDAFINFSLGNVTTPPVGYLPFPEVNGDLHIKYGHIKGDDTFVIKISSGFYDNPKLGLPSSNGLMMVLSAKTGEPIALLLDEGMLTDTRTAIAGAIASYTLKPAASSVIGIIGTGIQARLQLFYLSKLIPNAKIYVWGRNTENTQKYLNDIAHMGLAATACSSLETLCNKANIIITTTPSTEAIVLDNWVQPGTHITAVGADAPGKQELDAAIFKRAAFTVFDSKEQCIHHGEASHSEIEFHDRNSAELGAILNDPKLYRRQERDISVADLTGIAAQDIAIAKAVWQQASTNNRST